MAQRFFSVFLFLYWIATACGIGPSAQQEGSFDRRLERVHSSDAAIAAVQGKAEERLRQRVGTANVSNDPFSGSAKFVGSPQEFLTGPQGTGNALDAATLSAIPVTDEHRVVKAFLNEHRALFGHSADALSGARVDRDDKSAHNGMRTVVWHQMLEGIPVFDAILKSHVTAKGELVNIGSQFMSDPASAADKGSPNRSALLAAPPVSAAQALAIAAQRIGVDVQAEDLTATDNAQGAEKVQHFSNAKLLDPSARLTWFNLDPKTLRLCWDVLLTNRAGKEMFRLMVDAEMGEVYLQRSLTEHISPATYTVYTSDSPSPFSPGLSTPGTTQPAIQQRTQVTLSALDTTASPNGWIDDGVNETRGNNVDAHLDSNGNDTPILPRPQGSPSRVFNFALDLTQDPTTGSNKNAAVVQLFYLCNWMHDKLYQLGFDEASGNFQNNNFGKGGVGNDAVQADCQDGGGTDNANFSTPPDGNAPRMQMYIFTGPTPNRDGSLDAEVVLHEYTHGLSNRLVGGGVGISWNAIQTGGMGEGWSDFYALSLLSGSNDNVNGNYAQGGYVSYQYGGDTTFLQNYYYGIRRYPYTTDMTKNPLTFKDIDPNAASAHAGVLISPISGGSPSEVHNQGEVWCVTLWDARANLINKYGWTVGNQLMLQLVTDGMKLSPANPTFLQARDAILQADRVNNAAANVIELWAAFAKRGMGASATAPASTTTTGVKEAYDVPQYLGVSPTAGFNASGPVGGPFTPAQATYTLTNSGTTPLKWTATNTQTWLTLNPASGTLSAKGSATLVASLNSAAATLPAKIYTDTITITDTGLGTVLTRSVNARIGIIDYAELFDATSPNSTQNNTYTFTPTEPPNYYSATRNSAATFPSDTSTATPGSFGVVFNSGSSVFIKMSNKATFSFYGKTYSNYYISPNGSITFGNTESDFTGGLDQHFALPRISALLTQLYPGSSHVRRMQFSDRIAVTWLNTPPDYKSTAKNSFQIEMFLDGRIRITILGIDATGGVLGLSRGEGTPTGFTNYDFSSLTSPFGMALPTSITEGSPALTGTVGMLAAGVADTVINLTSSDPVRLVVPSTVTIPAGSSWAAFNMTAPADNKITGNELVSVTSSGAGFSGGQGSTTVIDKENTNLVLSVPGVAMKGDAPKTGAVQISGTYPTDLVVALSSSNTAVATVTGTLTIPAGQTSASFTVNILGGPLTGGVLTTAISASASGFTGATASLSVLGFAPGDTTHSGISNLIAYGLGLNPVALDRSKLPVSAVQTNPADGKDYFTFSYRRRTDQSGLIYSVETSLDLVKWTPVGTNMEQIGTPVPNSDGITETVTFRLKPAVKELGSQVGFARLRVSTP